MPLNPLAHWVLWLWADGNEVNSSMLSSKVIVHVSHSLETCGGACDKGTSEMSQKDHEILVCDPCCKLAVNDGVQIWKHSKQTLYHEGVITELVRVESLERAPCPLWISALFFQQSLKPPRRIVSPKSFVQERGQGARRFGFFVAHWFGLTWLRCFVGGSSMCPI